MVGLIASGFAGLAILVPFVVAAATDTPWQTVGLGAIASGLVAYLVKQNTDLSKAVAEHPKAQADHQRELVKLVSDVSISQTVYADAIKDGATANQALAEAMKMIARAIERDSATMERMASAARVAADKDKFQA